MSREEVYNFVEKIECAKTCLVISARKSLDHIFKELYVLPKQHYEAHLRLKIMELFLYLISEKDYEQGKNNYLPLQTVDKIHKAYDLLLDDLQVHWTIEEIANQVGINKTDLKSGFKIIYGDTIYGTLQRKRMVKAKALLETSQDNIAEIASAVGYSNPSKFSSVFYKVYEITPSKYRKSLKLPR